MTRTAAFILLAWVVGPAAAQPQVGVRDRDGNKIALPAPHTITVVQFMATWCAPCHEQTKALVALHSTYGSRGVRIAAVSLDRAAEYTLLPIYIKDFSVPYPIFVSGTVDQLKGYGFGDSLPAVVIFDRDGTVFDKFVGLVPAEVVSARLDWLTGDRAAARPPPYVPQQAEREEDELPHVHASETLARQAGRRAGSLVPS